MPYYVYRIKEYPIRILKQMEQHDTYRDAAASVKRLRADLPAESLITYRMMHAESEFEAEDLLNEVRIAQPGDD